MTTMRMSYNSIEFQGPKYVSPDPSCRGQIYLTLYSPQWLRKSYHQQLKNVHVPSALATTALDFDVEVSSHFGDISTPQLSQQTLSQETDSHFHESIQRWREISVQPSFISFASRVESMSRSFALLLHNWKAILELWIQVVKVCEEEALTPLLE